MSSHKSRALIVSETLPSVRRVRYHSRPASSAAKNADGTRTLEEMEKEAIVATLDAADGNKSEAARRLGISRKTLHNKLKTYGLG